MKKIFFDPIENRRNAGWRILIYCVVFLAVAVLASLALKPFMPHQISRNLITFLAISVLALGTL